jgi:signal peptidase I
MFVFKLVRSIIGIVVIFGLGYLFGVKGLRFYEVISESMLPTVEKGDRLIGERPAGLPPRGCIVVLDDPEEAGSTIVKRAIGLPGDLIEIRNGTLYRNREQVKEPYVKEEPVYKFSVEVPEGSIVVLGDNRNNSADSSVWGPAPLSSVRAVVVARYWPLRHFTVFRASRAAGIPRF